MSQNQRVFSTNLCLCCKGGNCWILGHVGDCVCSCQQKESRGEIALVQAMNFKEEYVVNERKIGQGQRAEKEVQGVNMLDEWEWFEQKEGWGRQSEQWARFLRRNEDQRRTCRRMIVRIKGVVREESNCLRKDCPACWKYVHRCWGIPYIPIGLQLRWVGEFLHWIQAENEAGEEEVCGVAWARQARNAGIRSGVEGGVSEEEAVFGTNYASFPTERRPVAYRKTVDEITTRTTIQQWFESSGLTIGDHLTSQETDKIQRLLYTWKELFITDPRDLPATDLVIHSIPTYAGAKPHRARDVPWTPEEEAWQAKNLPAMLGSVIGLTQSPWLAKTTFVEKTGTVRDPVTGFREVLRMVHTYCALNNATIKSNYPMKLMEPILNDLAKESRRYYFTADAANGYWAVPLLAAHAYKTAFSTVLGQCCYLRMGMGLSGAPHTYAMLKDITFGPIPQPNPEPSVFEVVKSCPSLAFRYFFDDDYGASDDFDSLYEFLQEWYFPRMSWAKLTLKPSKTEFMMPKMAPLGLSVGTHRRADGTLITGIKASMKKLTQIQNYPVPTSYEEVEKFLYLTIYLKMFIPGRAEHARVLKESCTVSWTEVEETKVEGKKKKLGQKKKGGTGDPNKEGTGRESKRMVKKKIRGAFCWGTRQEQSFKAIKEAVEWNICVGNDFRRRHYLAVDTSAHGFGAVFFQLTDDAERILAKRKTFPRGQERVVHFISQKFSETEQRYIPLERDCLAVLRSLEEVRWMAAQSRFPIITYIDQHSLVTMLQGDDTKGRMAGWQARMAEYELEIRHAKVGELDVATGLARMPYDVMDEPPKREGEWSEINVVSRNAAMVKEEQEGGSSEEEVEELESDEESVDSETMLVLEHRVFGDEGGREVMHVKGDGMYVGEGYLLVSCDGACKGNGSQEAKASVGIYCGEEHPANLAGMVPTHLNHTNQVAELLACWLAIDIGVGLLRSGKRGNKLVVALDSEYVCKGLTQWIIAWKKKDFKGIKNKELFKELDNTISVLEEEGIQVMLWKVKRAQNMDADRLATAVLESMMVEEGEIGGGQGDQDEMEQEVAKSVGEWAEFLKDEWYGEVVWYKIHGEVRNAPESRNLRRERKIRKDASQYVMVSQGNIRRLGKREPDGSLSECVRAHQVEQILHRFHDHHGHFAPGVMSRNLVGRFYWPGRFKDVTKWCHSCDACQRLGPLRPSSMLTPILQLQPMDMMGIDFIGPFSPVSQGDGKYIIMAVDYFSRYLWARVAVSNHGHIVEAFLKQDVARWFGWPLAVYVDNGSHFVKGVLPVTLKQQGVKLFSAPITNPRSVGLSERYVQMILAGLRAKVLSDPRPDAKILWHEHLPVVLHAINTRVLRVHGYTPSQLFMGFNARMDAFDKGLLDDAMREVLENHAVMVGSEGIEHQQRDVRLAQIEEMREFTRERMLVHQDDQITTYVKNRYEMPKEGDLVLLRRFVVDKERGRKLEPRWEGPYVMFKVAKPGVSGYLRDLKTQKVKGRYAFDALKVYVPRELREAQAVEVQVSLSEGLEPLCGSWYRGRESVDLEGWGVTERRMDSEEGLG